MRWSSGAQTLLIGAAFALLLLLSLGRVLLPGLPAPAGDVVRSVLVGAAVALLLPLPVLAVVRARRRVHAIEVDPAGLTLDTRRGKVRVGLDHLREVRALAEPAFERPRGPGRRGGLADMPMVVPSLRFRLADGAVWDFTCPHAEAAEAVLAWLLVLGAEARIARAPSQLAAQTGAERHLARCRALLTAAIGSAGTSLLLQLAERFAPGAVAWALAGSLAAIAVGCALYVACYAEKVRAAQAWVESRGLGAGPPPRLRPAPRSVAPRAR